MAVIVFDLVVGAVRVGGVGRTVAVLQVLGQHLRDAVGQGAHAVGAKAQRAPAADAGKLAPDFWSRSRGSDRRGQAQDVGDQPPDGLRDRGGVGAGLGGVDEDFEGLVAAVLVDGDEGLAQRGVDVVGVAVQAARAGLLALVPQVELLGRQAGLRPGLGDGAGYWAASCGGGVGLQHHLLARAGHVDGDALAAQLPGQHIGVGDIFFGGVFGEVDGLGERVVDKGLQGGLHAHVLLGGDVLPRRRRCAATWAGISGTSWQVPSCHHLLDDLLAGLVVQPGCDQGALEQRAGIGQLQVLAVVVDVADVGQGEDRLAAVAFAAGHGGNGAGRGDGGLGGVADAMLADALDDGVPIDRGAAQVTRVGASDGCGRLPLDSSAVS